MENKKIKIIISGGGTGGHVFPAIAIANALKKKVNDIDILFVGAIGKLEMEKVPAAGYPIEGLCISGFQRRLTLKNVSFPFKLLSSLWISRKIIKKFKPDVVVGVGGYASGAVVKVAASMGIPTLIQEQNSFPGITNRMLSKKANKICVAYQGMDKYFPESKIILTGNPVRQDIVEIQNKKTEALNYFGLSAGKKILFAVGGSLGARTINESILNNLEWFENNGVQIIWQTGKLYFETAKEATKKYSKAGIKTFDFINCMDLAYAAADIIISRAGAISVSELCIVGKPVILVPSPNVAEDHQTKNALTLVKAKAAVLVKDSDCRLVIGKCVIDMFNDDEKMKYLSKNINSLALKDAADVIASEVLSLVNKSLYIKSIF
ncbi:MAG: undecaprenyldiphospho-muramoylpentapeptide beta-N-acetylglucosaminyltransferase [Bacteroidales bacterium]